MNFSELCQQRKSVRRYLPKAVEKEKIQTILEACRLAPSACNSQPWKFIVVDEPELRAQVAETTYGTLLRFNRFVSQAPVLIVMVIESPNFLSNVGGKVKERDFTLIDNGIAAAHLCLQAADLGLGTCMIGWFDEKRVHELLKTPSNKRISLIITLGYEDQKKERKKIRKPLEMIWSSNSY